MNSTISSEARKIKYTVNGTTRDIAIAEANTKYNPNARHWEFWPGEYENALLAGKVIAYPAGKPGKRAATLKALEHDAPEVAAEVHAIIANHQGLIDRAIKAGQIVAGGGVEMVHRNGYKVKSQSKDEKYWISGGFTSTDGWKCDCIDWWNGNGARQYGWNVAFAAPYVPGLGCVACKHILAVLIAETLTPHGPCSTCNGNSFVGFENVETPLGLQSQCKVCPTCNGTGAERIDPEMPIDDWPDEAFLQNEEMSYSDLPLSDTEYHELQELRQLEQR